MYFMKVMYFYFMLSFQSNITVIKKVSQINHARLFFTFKLSLKGHYGEEQINSVVLFCSGHVKYATYYLLQVFRL